MKLFPAKCHERATLRKLWRQTGNSLLLPGQQFTVDCCCTWWLESQRGFQILFLFCFVLLYNKSLNDWSLGEQCILFPSNLNVSSRETLRFSGNKIHCSPRDQSLSVYYYSRKIFPRFWLVKTTRIILHNQLLFTTIWKESSPYWVNNVKSGALRKLLNHWRQNDVKSAARCRLLNRWPRKPGDKVVLCLVSGKTKSVMAKLL